MKTISAIIVDDIVYPETEFPDSAIKVVFNGTAYVVYEEGDELPPELEYAEHEQL